MANYQFSDTAIQDLNEICDYIAQQNARAASNLFDAIRQKCKLIANFPNIGKRYDRIRPNLRGFIVSDYIVFYYAQDNGIFIVRVVSGYRDLEVLERSPVGWVDNGNPTTINITEIFPLLC